MTKKVTAIFDIGKTNKKFFLFDMDYQEVYREYICLEETLDEDGFPADNLEALENWIKEVLERMLNDARFDISAVNFSSYGASLVHIDDQGYRITPLYNYLKPIPAEVSDSFYKLYGPEEGISRVTGSLKMGMLNAGLQLYWLKHTKPEVFKTIKYSLHLPQYLSYILTEVPLSEYTSIGCHTMLWDYEKKDYHHWVYQEEIDKILPPVYPTHELINIEYKGKKIQVGVGIHDSSAALLTYVRSAQAPFLLVSTGTWSIALNPFNEALLTAEDIKNGSLFNMRVNGNPVKVSRMFLGNEYKLQVQKLSEYFQVHEDYHRNIEFDPVIFSEINKDFKKRFKWISFSEKDMPKNTILNYGCFEDAYHQLMLELVLLQVENIRSAIGNQKIKQLFVDGGFSDNEVYLQLLSHLLKDMKLKTADSSLGSALGAAIAISDSRSSPQFSEKNYALKNITPFS